MEDNEKDLLAEEEREELSEGYDLENMTSEQFVAELERLRKRENKHTLIMSAAMLVLFGLVVAAIILTVVRIVYTKNVQKQIQEQYAFSEETEKDFNDVLTKLESLKTYLDVNYLFSEDVSITEVGEALYKSLFEAMDDPYTVYYNPEEYAKMHQSSAAIFYGIGVQITVDEESGGLLVVELMEDGGAIAAGIQKDDIIVAIDDVETKGVEEDKLLDMIKGELDTYVKITVLRPGTEEKLDFNVKRGVVNKITAEGMMLDDKVGYILIKQFADATAEQFKKAVEKLQSEGMKALIIDVRSNPGGSLTTVNEIMDYLLPEGIMVYTKDKQGQGSEYKSDAACLEMPMAVLVDENSASASEIFAGALQDFKWATIVGKTTYGKGIVQTIHALNDGSAVKVTVSRYYTPSGNCIHGIGIKPDIELEYELQEDAEDWKKDNQAVAAYNAIIKDVK